MKSSTEKTTTLEPAPSEDSLDPLRWPQSKKYLMLSVMCFSTFTAICAGTSPALSIPIQAKSFHQTPSTVSLTLSGTVGGLLIGPLIIIPLARVVGMCSCTFWSLIFLVAFCIWSAEASDPSDFYSYAVSRGFAGIVSAVPQILTGGLITNLFFRHERGKIFAIYSTIYTLGTVAGPTFCGFIIQHTDWTINFWWLVAANGLAAVLVFAILEETGFDRHESHEVKESRRKTTWLRSRIDIFLPGNRVVPQQKLSSILKLSVSPFIIGVSPVSILAGLYTMVHFSWFVIASIELPILLQEPFMPDEGLMGYGFDAQQTAWFFFSFWVGVLAAQAYGIALSDRLPLSIARRHGDWKPEYRLHVAWFPGLIVMPIGLGITGAALYYHLHYIVLALGSCFIAFAGVCSVPVSINYIVESFKEYPQEVGAAMNAYRLSLALALPFLFDGWAEKVGINWLFGMAAFFSIFAFGLVVILMWMGSNLRRYNLMGTSEVESEHIDDQGRQDGELG